MEKRITIITAATHKLFKPFLEYSTKQADKFGYKTYLIDLGEYGEGEKYDIREMGIHSVGKPWMVWMRAQKCEWILKAWDKTSGPRVWIDADAMILRPFDEVFTNTYDIAFPIRKDGRIGSGIFFINDTRPAKKFIETWNSKIRIPEQLPKRGYGVKGDQYTLEKMLKSLRPFKEGDIVLYEGTWIKFIPDELYNYVPRGRVPETVRILHLAGTKKKKRWELIKGDLPQ